MKKLTGMMMLISVLVLGLSFAYADQEKWTECEAIIDQVLFYNQHIDMKIEAAEIDAKQKDSPYEDIECMARKGEIEAAFYKDNRNQLLKKMLNQDLKPKDYKVHLFLVRAFDKAHPEAANMCNK